MRLLSNLKYFSHNKLRLLLLVVPLFLSVALLYTVHMITTSYFELQYNAFLETRKAYTSIQSRSSLITNDLLRALRLHENTEKIIPCILSYTEIDGVISTVGIRIYALNEADLKDLARSMELTLSSGRLPRPGTREIVLHETVLKNKGLAIGDTIGNEVDSEEKLTGFFEIVGTLKGKALAGFSSLETWTAQTGVEDPLKYGMLIYPKKGMLEALNRYINYLPLNGYDISSYSLNSSSMEKSYESIRIILTVIYTAVLMIVSLCLGFLTYLFYNGRLREFAILYIMGYSRQSLLLRSLLEILVINSIAVIMGILFSVLTGRVLNLIYFAGRGTPLVLFSFETLVLSLCAPMLCVIAQLVAVILPLYRRDMLDVIEQENGGLT